MADLTSVSIKSAVGGIATGVAFPFDPITMLVGLVASLIALLHIPPRDDEAARTPQRIVALVASGAFMAGVFCPAAVAGGIHYFPWLTDVQYRSLEYAAAALIGAAPHVMPFAWKLWRGLKGRGEV